MADIKISEYETSQRKLYFINEIVEWDLTRYIWTGCTDVQLRDKIIDSATELVKQVIRKQGLHTIYSGKDESSFGDLLITGLMQIERVLYKYRARPHCRNCYTVERPNESLLYDPSIHEYGIIEIDKVVELKKHCPRCKVELKADPIVEPKQGLYAGSETILYRGMSKVFNLWSQVSRTVILAYIKKENRDKKNSPSYLSHLNNKYKPADGIFTRFIDELKALVVYNENHTKIVNALEKLILTDDKPHEGIIHKLTDLSGLPRLVVVDFMKIIKLRSHEFTDSPINKNNELDRVDYRKFQHNEDEL